MVAQAPVSPLVGRDGEVAALLAAAEEARAARPHCVVVTGEAGIGKTRLVDEVLARVDDALVLTGHAADLATGEIPFGVLADTIRDLRHQRGEAALTPAERSALSPVLPGETSGGPVDVPRVLSAALDLLARLSDEQLVVWRVEDLHWADAASRDLLNVAVRSLRSSLLVVTTVRTGDPARSAAEDAALAERLTSLARIPHARRLDLRRLTDDEVRVLVGALADDFTPETVRTVVRLGDGVPFLVEELVASGGRHEGTTAAAALCGRMASVGREGHDLVQAAAIGDHRHLSLLEQVVDIGPEAFDAALAEAMEAAVLVCDPDHDRVAFRHALLREATIAATGPGAGRRWHRRWAEVLENDPGTVGRDPAALVIAEHWHLAHDVARSVSAAYAAIPAARRNHDEVRRLNLWKRILEGWDHRDPASPVGHLSLRQAVGEALRPHAWTVNASVADDFVAAARAHPVSRPVEVVLTAFEELTHRIWAGALRNVEQGIWADREVDWLAEPPDLLTRAALGYIGYNLPTSMDDRAESLLRRAEGMDRSAGRPLDGVLLNRGRAYRVSVTNQTAAAIEVLEQALVALPDEALTERMELVGDLCWNYIESGRHSDADRLGTRQLQAVPHPEVVPYHWEHVLENTVFGWRCTGQWDRARDAMAATSRWRADAANVSTAWLAHVDLEQRGGTEERRWHRLLEDSAPSGLDASDKPAGADEARFVLAWAHAIRGELSAMREMAGPLEGAARSDVDLSWLLVTELSRAEADHVVTGERRSDRAAAEEHLERLSHRLAVVQPPLPHERAAAVELVAQLDRVHGRDARVALAAALQAWTDLDHAPDVAVTHLSLAEAHAEAGGRDAAREHLTEGRRIAAELDARPWLDRAAAIAHRYGFTTRDRHREDVLTSREAEVLELLAEGRSNHEIADALVISTKTASVHVSRIIAKTGASNRTEAVAIARRHGLLEAHGQ